jgi:Ca2+-binding RTX toxin-like protein
MAITISATGNSVVENSNNYLRFTVTLSEPAVDAVTINYRTVLSGTAGESDLWNPSTFPTNNGVVTFAAGVTSMDIFIRTTGDSLDEADEHIALELFDPSNGTFADGTATLRTTGVILDDDGAGSNLALFVSDPMMVEDDSGSKFVTFEVRLSQPAPAGFSASYETINGSATAGSDYIAKSGTLNFVAGQEVATVTVQINGDITAEASETVFLSVKPNAGAPAINLTGTVGTATILDDDTGPAPVISLSNGSAVTESSSDYIRFTVTLSAAANDAITVNYRTLLAGTAGEDDLWNPSTFPDINGIVTFAPGETSKDIFIRTTGDAIDERDEHIVVELFDPKGARIEGGEPTIAKSGLILDDDGPGSNLALFLSDPVVLEGDAGQKNVVFEIRLSQPAPLAFTANYTTVDGTAVAGTDYVAKSGTVSFVAGQDVAYVTIPVIGNTVSEVSERFSLVVTPPANPSIGTDGAFGTATILDDDTGSGPVISLSGGEGVVESSSHYIRYIVSLSEASLNAVTVNFNTRLGTASDADLWNPASSSTNNGIVTFAPGETSKSIFIRTTGDSLDERDETIFLELTNPTNASLAGGQPVLRQAGFLLDDPADGVGLNIAVTGANATVTESSATQQLEILVTLSRPAPSNLTFNVTTTNQTAAAGSDFQLVDNLVTFAAGQTVAAITVNVLSDKASETVESFALNLALASGSFPAGIIPSTIVTINPGPIYGTPASETINGGVYNDVIYGLDGNDIINGLGGSDTLVGGNGNDFLDGGAGNDKMYGGVGNDTFIVNSVSDQAIEAASQGTDTVRSTISWTLGANIERLELLGTASVNGTGNALNNTIAGNSGNNTLNGAGGDDYMVGGAGNDTYLVASVGDRTVEAAGGGTDTVRSYVNWTLAANVERLELLGTGNLNGTGNSLANTIVGNSGNNILNGGTGADYMAGGAGNDIYYVDNGVDKTVEAAGGGTDTVRSSVTWTLAANVERLELQGAAAIGGTGNALNNTISGNSGNNLINGGAGNDYMAGGAGNDTFFFNTALGTSNIDTIADYNVAQDTIRLENGIFTALVGTGTLTAAQFVKNASGTATDTNDRIIYETDTGKLFYDSNGSAAGGQVQFAKLAAGLALTASDFFIV